MHEQIFFSVPYEKLLNDLSERLVLANSQTPTLQELKPKELKDELLTRNETAKLLGISLPTLHTWSLNGKLTAYRINTRVRYKRVEVMSALIKFKVK